MADYCLIVCIVPHDSGEFITGTATSSGAGGGTVVMARGTSEYRIMQALGLGDTSKDIVNIVVPSSKKKKVIGALVSASESKGRNFGTLFTIDTAHFMKTGTVSGGDEYMPQKTTHQMITVIANKGYADDIMAAARKAGAGGGTIINARGTAKPGDAKFFGMEIVPEKDMMMIVVTENKCKAILEAIRTLPCLAKPGSGVAFCCPAGDFTLLGKKS